MRLFTKPFTYHFTMLLLAVLSWQCRKDHPVANPPRPPDKQEVVVSIYLNGVPRDSLVYNSLGQVIEKWDYTKTYHHWQNYTRYTYNANGYITGAGYFSELRANIRDLTQTDSVVWLAGKMVIYSVMYRAYGVEMSGRDTSFYQLNAQQQINLAGTRDTIRHLGAIVLKSLMFLQYDFKENDISRLQDINYFLVLNSPEVKKKLQYDMEYGPYTNPLFRVVARNPLLLRSLAGEVFPLPRNAMYPFLGSEHYVSFLRYTHNDAAPLSSAATYTMLGNGYAQTQEFKEMNLLFEYHYKTLAP
ncbi:hypothetical protein [Chitinophaga vietnamensis]|uniref:hypothetical protein n=1 Tax=Chitinophaga vietnamensis TaxID=2593957 RepID=UPI0011789F16|nr:hypothetical protein [Chitinophaga vietnamensis]